MDVNNNNRAVDNNDPYFEEVRSKANISFDFVLWLYRILKYWYLFVISVALFVGYAYLKNKSWVAYFPIEATMILGDNGSVSVVSQAIPTGALLRSTENQQIVLRSYELTRRTVEKLPVKMHVDYFIQTRFKTISLYTDSPVSVQIDSLTMKEDIKPEAYNYVYTITYHDEDYCILSYKDPVTDSIIPLQVPYDQFIDYKFFRIKLKKNMPFLPSEKSFKKDLQSFNFRFLSDNQLVGMYQGQVSSQLIDENGTILAIRMYGPDPHRNIDYLNVLLKEFQNYNLDLKNEQADRTIEYMVGQLTLFNDSLEFARAKLEDFQKATGVYDIRSQDLRIEVDTAEREKDALALKERSLLLLTEKVVEAIEDDSGVEFLEPASLNINNPKLSQMIKEYNDLLRKYNNLGDKNPIYNRTVDILNNLRRNILTEVQVAQIRLQDQKDALVRKYDVLEKRLDNLPPQERELLKLQREFRINEMYATYLTQKIREAEMQKASNVPDNRIWEYPRQTGGATNGDVLGRNYTYYFLIGLILPLVFVILKEEVLNFSITSKEECEKISGLPVIGTIENVSKKLSHGVVLVKNYPKSSFAESFRNMRVRIEYMAQRENKITVLVTSTEPGDGKTFIATNIASVYQLMGKRVVIIDLDLRRPSVAKTLKMETQKGISNYLIGQATLDEIVVTHPDYGFDVIPAGTLPPNPSELIKTAKTKQILEYLKEVYDYVIIDCSPVGLVSDAYILSEIADTTLFVVRRAKTNRAFFKSVINQMKHDGVENVALVFNDVKGREGYYGTSRYYGDRTYYLKKNSYYHDDYFEN